MRSDQLQKYLVERLEERTKVGLEALVDLTIPETYQLSKCVLAITSCYGILKIAKAIEKLAENSSTIVNLMREKNKNG